MAESFFKKENNKKKVLKKKTKDRKKQDRKTDNNKGKGFESMIAYVDENGNLTSTPPPPKPMVETSRTPKPMAKDYKPANVREPLK